MTRLGLLVFVGTIAVAGVVLYIAYQNPVATSVQTSTISGVSCSSYSNQFTIIASESGYNDSVAHRAGGEHWPVVCARSGEVIKITVVNQDNVEPHGFSIARYLPAGVTVLPGKSTTLTFYAGTPGDFKIYCNVICAVHVFMQFGVFVVGS